MCKNFKHYLIGYYYKIEYFKREISNGNNVSVEFLTDHLQKT